MLEVYIHEAHAGETNAQYPEFAQFTQPKTMQERITIFEFYRAYIPKKLITSGDTVIIPALIDSINRLWENKYIDRPTSGWVIGFDGTIKNIVAFITTTSLMNSLQNTVIKELENTSAIDKKSISGEMRIRSCQASKGYIVVHGLSCLSTRYVLLRPDGSLVQKGHVQRPSNTIQINKQVSSGVYILRFFGNQHGVIPLILK